MSTSDALPGAGAQVVQAAAEFQWDGNKFEAGIGIAASGGGFRAMLFHAGAFLRLSELRLLAQAKRISSVSGGSIATGYLACVGQTLKQNGFKDFKQTYIEPVLAFSRQKIDVVHALTERCLGNHLQRSESRTATITTCSSNEPKHLDAPRVSGRSF